ncbi:MAG: hypothetical protein KDK23_03685, partial [Leptospiraceae bacterium]|nr:hypothetical protein [Leptospiraceae bacterium]
ERAPRIVTKRIPWIARTLLGDFVFQLASRDYPDFQRFSMDTPSIASPALFIEEKRTALMKLFSRECNRMGPISWEVDGMASQVADFCYVPYHHDSIYSNFDQLMPAIRNQIQTGSLGTHVSRQPPE